MTDEKPKGRRVKRRPLTDLPAHYVGSFLEDPDGWDFVTGGGVAEQTLGKEGKPLPLASGVMGKGGWVVERYQEYEDGRFVIHARCAVIPVACARCGGDDLIGYGSQTQTFHDMPYRMKRTTIVVARQRLRCKDCGKTQFQYLPHMDSNHMMTEDLKAYIREQSLKRTFTSIAEDVGIDEKTVRRIFSAYVDELEARHKIYTPEWLGIDEVHLTHEMRCVITDVSAKRPLEILEKRTKQVVALWLLQNIDPKVVKVVTMDMWNPYREAVHAALPGVKIVVDRFHVNKYANKALDTVRKKTAKALEDEHRIRLKHERKILLLRRDDLDDDQRKVLNKWLGQFSDLGQAYLLKEAFFDLYNFPTKQEAEQAYKVWLEDLNRQSDEVRDAFSEIVTFMHNWHDEIFNYFDIRATNAYTESVNGLLKQIYRNGRGYSFKAIRAKVLYGKLDHQR